VCRQTSDWIDSNKKLQFVEHLAYRMGDVKEKIEIKLYVVVKTRSAKIISDLVDGFSFLFNACSNRNKDKGLHALVL